MPFSRPTLTDLIADTQADAAARLSLPGPLLPVSNVAILARVMAGAVHGLYGYLDWISRQILPDTCDGDVLDRHAALWGLSRLTAAYASGPVTLSGIAGTEATAGIVLTRADGTRYVTTTTATIGSNRTASVTVQAQTAGAGGNLTSGAGLTLVTAIAGIRSAASVGAAGITGGADAEPDAALRARVLARLRTPPQGGAAADYLAWAYAAHPAVTRAWVYPEEYGAGSVTVRVMTDDETADGIPEQTVLDAVADAIDERRPVTAAVAVEAPVADPLDPSIRLVPNTSAVRAAVESALADLIRRETEPGGTLLISHIREAISTSAGETDHTLLSPVANVTAASGAITTLGTITWSS
jgi:uncharacterized phage protein gp47/JayE